MAPPKDMTKKLKIAQKELSLWPLCTKAASVPPEYVSLSSAKINFDITFQVWYDDMMKYENFVN